MITIKQILSRWDSGKYPLIKGKLIDSKGRCCAQGDILRCAGYTDDHLRIMLTELSDKKVAQVLNISIAESILLRLVNDSAGGCPQDVFRDRGKILGKHHKLWTAFAHHLDTIKTKDWLKINKKYYEVRNSDIARDDLAYETAKVAVSDGALDSAYAILSAAFYSVGAVVTGAAYELLGWSALDKPYFLYFFFDDPAAWVKAHE